MSQKPINLDLLVDVFVRRAACRYPWQDPRAAKASSRDTRQLAPDQLPPLDAAQPAEAAANMQAPTLAIVLV